MPDLLAHINKYLVKRYKLYMAIATFLTYLADVGNFLGGLAALSVVLLSLFKKYTANK